MDVNTLKAMLARRPCKQLMDSNGEPVDIWITCPARISFVSIKTTETYEGEDSGKFCMDLIFPEGADLSILEKAAKAKAKEKFGDKAREMWAREHFKPFYPCSKKEKYAGYRDGGTYTKVSSEKRPLLYRPDKSPISVNDPDFDDVFYAGCWVQVKVNLYAYDNKSKGVRFGFREIMKVADDEPFAGGAGSRSGDGFEAEETSAKSSKAPAMAGADDF